MSIFTQYKEGSQQLKWDTFIGRKGGINNTLSPIKTFKNTNVTSSLSSPRPEWNQTPKLDPITARNQEEQPSVRVVDRQQEKLVDHQKTKTDEATIKDIIKGKPIIFISGGPGKRKTIE